MNSSDLIKSIKGAASWTSTSLVSQTLLQILQLVILSRYIEPSEFGDFSIVVVCITILLIFIDFGTSNALIQRQESNPINLSTLYWLNIISSFILYFILFILSGVIGDFYNSLKLEGYLKITGITIILISIGYFYQYYFQKEFKFKYLAISEVFGSISGFIIAIILGIKGYSIYALIIGYMVNNFVKYGLLLIIGMKFFIPKKVFKIDIVIDYVRFGKFQVGEKLIHYITYNMDYMLIGKLLGSDVLGYYNLAYQIVIAPITKITPIITQISFSLFSKVKDQSEVLKKSYLKSIELIGFVNIPISFGLIFLAPIMIPTLFGDNWDNSIKLVQILGVLSLFRSLNSPLPQLALSIGNAKSTFKWSTINFVILTPTLVIGAMFGDIYTVCIMLSVSQIILYLIGYYWYIKSIIFATWMEYLNTIKKTTLNGLIMYIILNLCSLIFYNISLIYMIIFILIGVISYVLVSLFNNRGILNLIFKSN